MTAKEYLQQARFLDSRIKSKVQQIDSLNALATHCTATISDMPRNPKHGGSRMEEAIIKIIALQEEINADIVSLVELKRDIVKVVKSIPGAEHQTVIEKRYLCCASWEQIAVDLGYSIQHIYRLHDAALEKIEQVLKDESKCD